MIVKVALRTLHAALNWSFSGLTCLDGAILMDFRLNPSWSGQRRDLLDAKDTFFVTHCTNRLSFLETEMGLPFVSAFRGLRLQYISADRASLIKVTTVASNCFKYFPHIFQLASEIILSTSALLYVILPTSKPFCQIGR